MAATTSDTNLSYLYIITDNYTAIHPGKYFLDYQNFNLLTSPPPPIQTSQNLLSLTHFSTKNWKKQNIFWAIICLLHVYPRQLDLTLDNSSE